MPFLPPPRSAAWAHQDARSGFEVAYFQPHDDGHLLTGATTAVEDGQSWIVDYEIRVDVGWRTRSARVTGRSTTGACRRLLEGNGEGGWRIDGEPAPHLDGCLDVDLESSAMTNAMPVHRFSLSRPVRRRRRRPPTCELCFWASNASSSSTHGSATRTGTSVTPTPRQCSASPAGWSMAGPGWS